jgi:hypothetical protein
MVTNHVYHASVVAFASAEEECQLLSVALEVAWILSVALEVAWIFTLNSEITGVTRRVGRFSWLMQG